MGSNLSKRASAERKLHDKHMVAIDFDRAPFTIAWEVTRACAFACVHCRADDQHHRDPRELTTREGFRLIDRFKAIGNPILVFTGMDPMMRRDLFDLIAYAVGQGVRCSLTSTATSLLTDDRLQQAQGAGIRPIALSLDAPSPQIYDDFRQVVGSWDRTMRILRNAQKVGLSAQVNTTVTKHNVDLLSETLEFVQEVGAVQWSVFFLVPTGRGLIEHMISAEQHEKVFNWLYDLFKASSFDIKATAAPMYRRVAIERKPADLPAGGQVTFPGAGFQYKAGLNRPRKGVNDGKGFTFISHLGEIMSSGSLSVSAGNVRELDVVEVYREHEMFRDLRDPEQLKGKCGICEYRELSGGQRGRAYAVTGDFLETDPACLYEPQSIAA